MRISTQMLLAVVGITVLSQVIFAAVAYWLTTEAELENQFNQLNQHTMEVARDLVLPLAAGEQNRRILESSRRRYAPGARLAILHDTRNALLSAGPLADNDTTIELETALLKRLVDGERSGETHSAGETLLWTAQPLSELPYTLVLLETKEQRNNRLWSTLSLRFLTVGVVILWLAVWVALLMASLITKKLHVHSEELRHHASHDSLTTLPNRAFLYEHLQKMATNHEGIIPTAGLLAINIDRFKDVNDTLGHKFGDELLIEVGQRIESALCKKGWIARLGGDEFAVLIEDAGKDDVQCCAERILAAIRSPISVKGIELEVSLTIGIAFYPEQAEDVDCLIRHADVALHQAKDKGVAIAIYDTGEDRHSIRRLQIGAELRGAIERKEMLLHYQPKIDLQTYRITGFEALIRWQHPAFGIIPPDEFIPLAEQTGVIIPMTDWILQESLSFLAAMRASCSHLSMSVNISAASLRDPAFTKRIMDCVLEHAIPYHYLTLEITETATMRDPAQARHMLYALHEKGVCISVDDFGTGYSSLAYLKTLPVDELKVDREFIRDMGSDQSDEAIVHSIIDMARNLGFRVVAEGVEHAVTLECLRRLGCHEAQGYYICKPLPADEIMAWKMRYDGRRNLAKSVTKASEA